MTHRLFISHKHADRALARQLADFIDEKTGSRVEIHLSSDPEYGGPVPGRELNRQLREALWQTEALLLVYTEDDRDWSYCMWECGVATRADSPDTNIIVLQCGSTSPTPYAQDVHVNIRLPDDLRRFADVLLRGRFFANQPEPLFPNMRPDFVRRYSEELHERLRPHWPPIDPREVPEWPIWPRLTLSLSASFVAGLRQATESRVQATADELRTNAAIVAANHLAGQVFGQGGNDLTGPFGPVWQRWERLHAGQRADAVVPLAEQIADGLTGAAAVFRRLPRTAGNSSNMQPLLASIRQIDAEARYECDLLFLDADDPRGALVVDCMIPIRRACYLAMPTDDPTSILLLQIRDELINQDRRRIPILGPGCQPRYIARRRLVDRFFADMATGRLRAMPAEELTLAQVLELPSLAPSFRDSFVTVDNAATVSSARQALRACHVEAEDIFVTEDGTPFTRALGWLPL